MQPLRTYDYLCLARKKILDWTRPLSPDQYTRQFPIGPGSLARTLTHIMICEWYYVERMLGRNVPGYEQWPIKDKDPPPLARLEAEWSIQAEHTRAALRSALDWAAPIEYRTEDDQRRPIIVTTSAADIFTQLALHEVHHRAQAMNMLRHLGVTLEDIDFNAFMYQRRPA